MSATPDSTLANLEQRIADLERQLAERENELAEAREQQAATAEILEVINSSPGGLAPVFDAILDKAHTLCEAEFGSLFLYDGEHFRAIASHGVPEALASRLREGIGANESRSSQQLIAGAPFAHIHDSALEERAVYRGMDMVSSHRTLLSVPLRKCDALLGMIVAGRLEVRPFTDKQIALLQNFAAQAVIAIDNARLLTETREALDQQTATAEVLQVINSSPGDLAPVFDAMLERAMRLCEAAFGMMHTFDGAKLNLVSHQGLPPVFAEFVANPANQPVPHLVRDPRLRFVHVIDLKEEATYRSGGPMRRALVDLGGARTLLAVPLRKDGATVGVINIYRQEVRAYTDKQISLMENFAAQAVIAMENARLITETREALEQQTATAEVLGVINASPGDLAPVFDAMLEKALALCDAAYGHMLTYDGESFTAVAARGPATIVDFFRDRPPTRPAPGTTMYRLLQGERFAQVADLAGEVSGRGNPTRQALVDLAGARSGVSVGLRKDGALLGAISLYRQEVWPFSDKQIALLQNFAAQAVIAMENARLLAETREALEQQTATAEVLQVINSSPGDLTPVFDAILEKAHTLCGAALGGLVIYDGEEFRPVAVHADPSFAEYWRANPVRPPREGNAPLARLVRGEPLVHLADVRAGDAHRELPGGGDLMDRGGVRTLLMVPLRKEGALLGAISAYRQEVRPFADKQIALLQNFAAQAVVAMENARLLTETREALEQQTATAEVLQVINSSPGDLAPVWDAMLEKATRLCEAASGILWTYDGSRFRAAAIHGAPEEYVEWVHSLPDPVPSPSLARIASGEKIVRDDDLATAPGTVAYAHTLAGMRTGFLVALRKGDALLGAIRIFRQDPRPFSDTHIVLVENFAAQAVIAMENARLITETREALEQQTATAEILGVINSSPGDLKPVFDAILDKAHSLCGVEYGVLLTYDGELFWPVAMRGAPASLARRNGFRPSSGFRGLLRGERLLHIHNMAEVAAQTPDEPVYRDLFESGGILTQLAVPLRKDGRLLGIITANRREVKPFSDRQIALLENFAAQAVIAIENARLITETREALEQQTATAEVLQVINSSPGDLTPVFDAILEKAHAVCGAALGGLLIYEGEEFRPIAIRAEPSFAEYWRQTPVQPPRGGDAPYTQLIRGERIVHLPDVRASNAYRHVQVFRDLMDRGHIRTLLVVPLRKDNALLGAITAFRQEVRPFTDQQIALLQNFAQQAVIAIENGRLLDELRQRTNEVAELNRGLEARVAEQVEELGRVGRLKRFLAPQLAELIVSQGDEKILESHRREIVVVFCDLRGYTAFTETAEPEEVLDFLREYHGALGPLVSQFEGTLDQFSGDGIMVFFNDPVPCPDPAERAVKMATAMREAAGKLIASWRRRGRLLGFGAGIAQGYATLGQIGFAERSGYTAIGTVCNLAARLCAEAEDGQILIGQRVAVAVEETITLEEVGALTLKGLTQPVVAYNVPVAASQPALRVIEGGPQSV